MLFKVVVSPVILDSIPNELEIQKHFFNSVILLLTDLEENTVLLTDTKQKIRKKLQIKINDCPVKYRKKLKVLLRRLKRNLVVKEIDFFGTLSCSRKICRESSELSISCLPAALFTVEDCCKCIKLQNSQVSAIDFSQYSSSSFFKVRREKLKKSFTSNEINAKEFAKQFVIPLFEESKHVKIYDRMIGDTILENGIGIKDNYKHTLEWLVALFQKFSMNRPARRFIIYSGLFTGNLGHKKIDQIRKVICNFEADIQARVDFSFKVIFKQEIKGKKLTHARYLITEHMCVLFERGFDLLTDFGESQLDWCNPEVDSRFARDVAISVLSKGDKKKIARYVQSLNDL